MQLESYFMFISLNWAVHRRGNRKHSVWHCGSCWHFFIPLHCNKDFGNSSVISEWYSDSWMFDHSCGTWYTNQKHFCSVRAAYYEMFL